MKVLDLFSGIGGFSLGLERAGMETVAFCEIDPFCQKVLKKHWPNVPVYEDVRSLDYDGPVDLICGGFPCQPFSVAGKQKGAEDDRHLWPAMFSLIQKHQPSWVIGENVAGFINMALDDVLAELESEGYETRAFVIPACGIGAPHRRERVWIVGYAKHNGSSTKQKLRSNEATSNKRRKKEQKEAWQFKGTNRSIDAKSIRRSENRSKQYVVANTESVYAQRQHNGQGEGQFGGSSWWAVEPSVGRVANGVPSRVDRLRSLGNAVVPQIPEILGRAIMEVST